MISIDESRVASQVGVPRDGDQWTVLFAVCKATTSMVSRWVPDKNHKDKEVVLGCEMLAARLWRRRSSPSGVESLGELGTVYVARYDPDIAILLGLGSHARPMVG